MEQKRKFTKGKRRQSERGHWEKKEKRRNDTLGENIKKSKQTMAVKERNDK